MTCPLFVELCAGTAALSLRLHRRHARPPVSRMGAKTGYADAILRVLGLRPGQGAAHYLWCEPDPGVRLLLEAYRDANLAREAAAIIRGWADEEPRALWERLRAEGPPRGVEAGEVARWARLTTANRLIPATWVDGQWRNTGDGGSTFGGAEFCTPVLDLAEKFEASVGDMPATVEADARRVDPREVARWRVLCGWAYRQGEPESGFAESRTASGSGLNHGDDAGMMAARTERAPTLPATITPDARRVDPREVARWAWVQRRTHPGNERSFLHQVPVKPVANPARQGLRWTHEQPAPLFEALPVIEATIVDNAGLIEPGPDLPPGTVAYMDPPYVGTTGYGHDLPRSEVVTLARRWAAAGAMVAISEAEPIGDLVAEGWHAVRIDGERKGQARTFSKQKDEWLTLSNAPTWTPKTQVRLPF